MGDDWDTVTKIGKTARPQGASDRETTVKGKGALNAALRSGGVISTEKKYSGANSGGGSEGQHATKVDRDDGITKLKKVSEETAKALSTARNAMTNAKGKTMTQKELATKANVDVQSVASLEKAGSDFPSMDHINKLQKAANVRLTGSDIGGSFFGKKKTATSATSDKKGDDTSTPTSTEPASAGAA